MNGYTFKNIKPKNAHDIIAATYVLTMYNSKRDFARQLDRFSPSLNTYIVINEGYKKNERPLCKQMPVYDVVFSYVQIFKHAQLYHKNKPILLLEDDFFWRENVDTLPEIIKDIMNFLNDAPSVDHYWLGCIPLPSLKFVKKKGNHVKINSRALASHSVISTPKGMASFINTFETSPCEIEFPDPYMSENHTCYRYNEQLCYQLFEDSPSQQQSWPTYLPYISKALQLHKKAEPMWTFFYKLHDNFICLLLVILIIIIVAHVNKKRV